MAALVKQQNALPADIIFTTHTVGQNRGGEMALACSVSRLEKSHTNSIQQKNPNQTQTVRNYFPNTYFLAFFQSIAPTLPHIPLAVF